MNLLDHGDSRLLAWLKVHFAYALHKVLAQPKQALAAGGVALEPRRDADRNGRPGAAG